MTSLRIGGLVPFTAIDYPGHLSAVIFCQGCPWRCAYCHNRHLLPARGDDEIAWEDVLALLARRRGLLDAVVFSGGEPTLQRALGGAIRAVRAMGFRIGLHTAGCYPRRLAEVLPLVDWVGLDVKAPWDGYARVTGSRTSGARARESLALVLASGVSYTVRTTVEASVLTRERLDALSAELAACGVRGHVLQPVRPRNPAIP